MSTAIQDPYLAESIGHSIGRRRGEAAGYDAGWDDAVLQANQIIAQKDRELQELRQQVEFNNENINLANTWLREGRLNVERLNREIELLRETSANQRQEYEHLFHSFLGVVAIAHPAIKAVAALPFDQRRDILDEYGKIAIQLLGVDYINGNRFPHNQALIKQHLPIAHGVYTQISKEVNAYEAQQEKEHEAHA